MSRGINKVILIGNLGQQPELKNFNNGTFVSNISLATSSNWTDKNSGERKDSTEWHKLVFMGKSAEILAQYCHKGSKLYIEGRLQTRKWLNQSGNEQYTTEIKVLNFQMLDSKHSFEKQDNSVAKPKHIAEQTMQTKNKFYTQSGQEQYNKDEIDWDKEIPW